MKTETRQRVKAMMEAWVADLTGRLRRRDVNAVLQGYPFHQLIFSPDALLAARQERTIVTSMGSELYPRLADALARDRFQEVVREHTTTGEVNEAACNMIEQIVTELRAPGPRRERRLPNRVDELESILSLSEGEPAQRSVIADLYVGDYTGGPLFVELKTPLPNLDIAAESKKKMLYFLAIKNGQNVAGAKAFIGLTYNPYVTKAAYKWSITPRIFDMDAEVLIGSELWDYLGGPGAYDELLKIIAEINPPKS